MAFPVGVETVTVTAGASGYRALDGTPYTGTIRFTPSVSRVVSATHGVIALGTVNASLSASGDFTASLLATDAEGFSPSGWTYRVDEEFANAPGRAWDVSLPAAVPAVALPALLEVESTAGTVSTPAVLSVNEKTGVVTLAASEVGAAASSTQITAGAGLTGGGTLAADRTLAVAFGTTGATVCVGNDARLSDARTPTVHAASHASASSDPITVAQSQVTGLTAALGGKADLAGATFTGAVTITGNLTDAGNFLVRDSNTAPTKGYRFRTSGGALDTESGGQDWFISTFPNADFSGTQNNYFRMEAGAAVLHVTAEARFDATAFGGRGHTLDGPGNKVGFYGANPAAKPTVSGAKGGNAALASLLTALATLGLITDSTTA